MVRPPLPLGSWGKMSRDEIAPGVWRAMCGFRDFDPEFAVVAKEIAPHVSPSRTQQEITQSVSDALNESPDLEKALSNIELIGKGIFKQVERAKGRVI